MTYFTGELRDCFGYCVENAGSFGIPFVTASYNACFEIEKLVAIDNHCDICTPNHVAKRASTRQGRSMLETCGKSFANSQMVSLLDQLQCCHLPVVYGACCGIMGINIKSTMTTFLYSTLRSSIASSIRLDKVGPIEAQIIQTNLQKTIPDVVDRYRYRTVEEACIVFPVIDMIQNAHDNMFSKLFYS
ncbi:urease accessory protein [Mytilus galloprovincialis]|uniref:Urease accessory protein n=1 Tax=Mytilus galloprovincialis TaxID=29158 RepID=A0A8B6DY68_MYTGA|nr:urease accessory protein [Mytilus galloprovincialis]